MYITSWYSVLLACLAAAECLTLVNALRNITIDDSDPAIIYQGKWTVVKSKSAYGGSVHTTSDPAARAILTFNGTAAYPMAPLLKSLPQGFRNQFYYPRGDSQTTITTGGPSTKQDVKSVVYDSLDFAESQKNGTHRIVISIDTTSASSSNPAPALVDAFMYTTDLPPDSGSSSSDSSDVKAGGSNGVRRNFGGRGILYGCIGLVIGSLIVQTGS